MVGRLVLESVRDQMKPADWTAEKLAAFDPAFTADMARYLRPAEGIETRELPGGTGPKAVAKALADAGTRIIEMAK
jgi:argininosuccinate lyase